MATERTFSILKPDATNRNLTGEINAVIEKAAREAKLSPEQRKQLRAGPRRGAEAPA